MPVSPQRRQKKLERQRSKQKAEKRLLARRENMTLAGRLKEANYPPFIHCLCDSQIQDRGMGQLLVSRQLPGGDVALAVFLLDTFCLGVKNAFGRIMPKNQYDVEIYGSMIEDFLMKPMTPANAKKLVDEAIAYAENLAFPPHPDCRSAYPIFANVDSAEADATFTFGLHGKPCFMAGPHDSPHRIRQILLQLDDQLGPDGYSYAVPPGMDPYDDDDEDDMLVDDDDEDYDDEYDDE